MLLILLACTGTDSQPTPELRYYLTCGDPVCNTYSGPFDGIPLCTTETLGETCTPEGSLCDPQNDCNAKLTCAFEDPTQQVGGCPISRAKYKDNIHYLDIPERQQAAQQVLDTKLATWRYKWEEPGGKAHLGFIIDDQEHSPAVAPSGEQVDLYGYTSLTVAAIQAQQAQIDAQQAQILALKAELDALKAELKKR